MAEYIDREAAINAVEKNDCEGYASWAIKSVPTADVVERKHGKWKYQTMVHESGIKANGVACSICGATYNLSITLPDMMVEALNFCPNCGARMESEEEE